MEESGGVKVWYGTILNCRGLNKKPGGRNGDGSGLWDRNDCRWRPCWGIGYFHGPVDLRFETREHQSVPERLILLLLLLLASFPRYALLFNFNPTPRFIIYPHSYSLFSFSIYMLILYVTCISFE